MFEKFTEGAIKVIMLSQEEARRMGHNFVGTEQLLLGVIGQRHGIGARALKKIKVTLKKTRKEIELYIGRGTGFVASEIPFTPRAKRVLEMAVHEGKDLGQNFVGTEHILLALIAEPDGVARRTLDKMRVNLPNLRNLVLAYIEETQEEMLRPLSQAEKYLLERERRGSQTPTLDEYAENISKEAVDGELDPVIGREKEIDDVIATLARRRKNNPVLIGEPGVGKTAVAEGLAQLILTEKGPNFLDGSIIMALDLGSILAGTKYRGEFEERLKRIVEEAQNERSVIVVIDEIHTLVGAGAAEGAVDAANILKPALARGKFRCIGATTNEEYRKYIERDAALERRFQPVRVDEPSVGTTIEILRGLRSKFEQHHALSYHDKALEQAAILSNKYIADRFLPDKAIDVIDEAAARVRLENRRLPKGLQILLTELQDTLKDKEECVKDHDFDAARQLVDHEIEVRTHIRIMKKSAAAQKKRLGIVREDIDIVNENDIANVISNWTGVPVNKLTGSESERLMKMEEELHKRLIGQDHAVTSVSKAVRRARVGLNDPNRPIASFIFAGPTGVGKTELTKALSDYMFSTDMIRLDMSEFMEKHTVAKLIGSPPGYVGYNEGGLLTEAVRSTPYTVVLFDEVEKAHPDVFNLLLQILDDGRLSDSKGRVVDFTNTLIIMTTNLGSKIIERESGIKSKLQQGDDRKFKVTPDAVLGWEPRPEPATDPKIFGRIKGLVHEELKNFFRPEFLNRIDEIIVFNHLTRLDLWRICGLMIDQIKKRLADKDLELVITFPVQAFLTDEGYDPLYGARPLRRSISKYLEDTLAEQCLSQTLFPNTKIIVRRKRVEDSILTYTNELEVEINFDNVDRRFFEEEGTEGALNNPSKALTEAPVGTSSDTIDSSGEQMGDQKESAWQKAKRKYNERKDKRSQDKKARKFRIPRSEDDDKGGLFGARKKTDDDNE
uniref:Clp protease ATP binding subunit n=1 Tax=Pseudo-nitzschia multiseries TaxID=37319 RepID=A0A0K1DBW8_PSEMU|nr:Clp protease ATP binding subunit [Pseudo-nitzschia multiseries]AKT26056.1 Clp protease ATP binding subunit [Pseudo-nitzschia multiseries]UBA15591.1 Clp protease ATP binding subunit [Pseudo-nitzschia multiseries]